MSPTQAQKESVSATGRRSDASGFTECSSGHTAVVHSSYSKKAGDSLQCYWERKGDERETETEGESSPRPNIRRSPNVTVEIKGLFVEKPSAPV